jgi:hypothetical protein
MRIARAALIRGLAAAAVQERKRREAAAQAVDDDVRERLFQTLDVMAERMRAAPGWREPTEEERRASIRVPSIVSGTARKARR